MAQIFVTDRKGVQHVLDAEPGQRVMEVIRDAGLPIEALCGGNCACATCHCHVDDGWLRLLTPPQDEELGMLEMAFGVNEASRLTCQIRFKGELDGLHLTLGPN